jgi:hypothetical protein
MGHALMFYMGALRILAGIPYDKQNYTSGAE